MVVVGGGQNSLPEQTAVDVPVTEPDIAVLLAATSDNPNVAVLVIVAPSAVALRTSVQDKVTVLPETEPLIELVTIVTPAVGARVVVPETDESV